jgi:hypothetical protein
MHRYFLPPAGNRQFHLRALTIAATALVCLGACTPRPQTAAFDPRTCLDIIPEHVDGLQILAGPRSARNIIHDMVPPVCNGRALYRTMQPRDPKLGPGTVSFHVTVEYTGEVVGVSILETTIRSGTFLRELRDFIMDSDFTPWARSDIDSVFIYPIRFGP